MGKICTFKKIKNYNFGLVLCIVLWYIQNTIKSKKQKRKEILLIHMIILYIIIVKIIAKLVVKVVVVAATFIIVNSAFDSESVEANCSYFL